MNNDLISRNALKEAFENLASDDYNEPIWYQQTVFETIDNAPAIPLPDYKEGYKQAIVDGKTNFSRPHGEWIHCLGCGVGRAVCSECRQLGEIKNYCGECGAEMKEADDE